jgi:type III pantothenate kinase
MTMPMTKPMTKNSARTVLAVDCGNTRLKWGLHDGASWQRIGVVGRDELDDAASALAELPEPDRILISNVAGAGLRLMLETALARFAAVPVWLQSLPSQCGVTNGYEHPGKLGVDRWCALIGARHLQSGACLVVGTGTATTVDMLSADGHFLGGLILPGFELMKRSLSENTAALPFAEGAYVAQPRNTADAIETGVLHAQAGAIERMAARLRELNAAGKPPACLISGGAAPIIAAALGIPYRVVDHLVLEGVARIAVDADANTTTGRAA